MNRSTNSAPSVCRPASTFQAKAAASAPLVYEPHQAMPAKSVASAPSVYRPHQAMQAKPIASALPVYRPQQVMPTKPAAPPPPVYRPHQAMQAKPIASAFPVYRPQQAMPTKLVVPSPSVYRSAKVLQAMPTFVVRRKWPSIYEHTEHYLDSMGAEEVTLTYLGKDQWLPGHFDKATKLQWIGVKDSRDFNRQNSKVSGIYYGRKEQLETIFDPEELDEFPYASTFEGGDEPSVSWVRKSENASHGSALRTFYLQHGLKHGDRFSVRLEN